MTRSPSPAQAAHVSDYAPVYDPDTDFDAWLTRFIGRRIAGRLGPADSVLEIGCATGGMTALLAPCCDSLFAIERSPAYVEKFQQRGFTNAKAVVANVEGWQDTRRFDHVVATGMFGNLRDPQGFLGRCREFLALGGQLHLSAANPRSLHRLAAAEMGLIANVLDASPADHMLGNRNFSIEDILAMAEAAGLACAHREGVLVKPLPNSMMAALPPETIEAMDRISRFVPEFCAVTYFVFRIR